MTTATAEVIPIRNSESVPQKKRQMRKWLAVIGASLGAFIAILDIQVTNASLREISGSLGLDMSESGWISTAYLIAETIMIPLTGYLSEVFGVRRFITWNCVLFVIASMLCGLSWNLPSLICFRAFQGFVGGALVPMAFQILLVFIPRNMRHISMVIFGLTATLAPTIGPSLGGWITDAFGWRYIFFFNVLPGILMISFIMAGIRPNKINWGLLKNIDILGILSLSIGLGTLTYVLEEGAHEGWFEDRIIQICTLVALVSLTTFLISQLLKKHPILNLYALTERNFLLTSLITMITGAALYGGIFSLSLYLGQIHSYTPSQIGQTVMWIGIPQLFVMPLVPLLMKRINLKFLAAIGLLMFAYSNYINAFMDFNYAGDQVRWSLFIRALGQPLFLIPISTIGMSLVGEHSAGNASAIFNMMRNLGGSMGVSLAGTFLISKQQMHQSSIVESIDSGSSLVQEYVQKIEMAFRSMGYDVVQAKLAAAKTFLTVAIRDSFIESFNDVFFILAIGLFISVILIIILKPVSSSEVIFE
jgi:DHA2 family multidrug resistance protein